MSGNIRSFIAFDIEDQQILKRIIDFQRLIVNTGADLKLVEPQNIHITIRFLGNITPTMVDQIHEEMKKISFAPFKVRIQGVGAFPNIRYPRVIWVGMTQGTVELRNIFSQLEPNLRKLGFNQDPKGFSPHITIARVKSGRNKEQLIRQIEESQNLEFGTFTAKCLRLKKSDLTPKGPIYSTLREVCP
ncbi:RNA 2',3'-cyclic phosphodiesterase [Candidatus Bathyarchaeota archaeon]|nr:RNA 2',3'-cyclic phosphodiesterase [Candidatus Bathyarchaeota archaeon]